MLVFSKARLVFLSVPKTGTTAYETALSPLASMIISDPPELKHTPLYRYNRFFRPALEKFIGPDIDVIAVMREPVSWLGSWFRYRQRSFLHGHPNGTHDLSFDAFVAAYCQQTRPPFANVGSQAKFLEPTRSGTRVSRIFRYEDQPQLIAFLEERLEAKLDLSRKNVSPEIPLGLAPEIEDRLRHRHADEFALYASLA
ncbi:gamma-glutamyl kinase [Pseudooceanicola sediminis]|uniref:Gamma-glutamyl kinase n=1 Tax=Pseudooceanicola sediminis TaxID=2211117 RepID=A0A399J5C6_9RHOB|nr:gamma-glutamyl kinase [Pseudooceanicola sediminis]KAA2316850.1 gamma-glutamyl kinase [Puniceibacterium sp. HSS470]RII40693.1 gamma-glutamyl kinase [Pseudooceanicola sediminis]|tara:strand:+ start:157062 stop:157655 length:594 start_codon:yes stop_codon:yes gene_type:complete